MKRRTAGAARRAVARGAPGKALLALCPIVVAGCGNGAGAQSAAAGDVPGAKQALRALLSTHDVPLTVHDSCANVGSELADTTIGDYVAGLLAELRPTSPGGNNTIAAECSAEGAGRGWRCSVEVARRDGDDEWVRGVEFLLSEEGGVSRDSIRCTGGG